MGLSATDLSITEYGATGSSAPQLNPPAIHYVLSEAEADGHPFSLYQGSGGDVASRLTSEASGTNTTVQTVLQNNLATAIEEICKAFGLKKTELTEVCKVKSRKTLYNWINGESKPNKSAMTRLFELLITARAWHSSGFGASLPGRLREAVLGDQSVFDLLNQPELDRERILFAGSRLHLSSLTPKALSDPFA